MLLLLLLTLNNIDCVFKSGVQTIRNSVITNSAVLFLQESSHAKRHFRY